MWSTARGKQPDPPSFQRRPQRLPVKVDLPTRSAALLERVAFVEVLHKGESLGNFLILCFAEEAIEIVLTQVTDDLHSLFTFLSL